MPSLGKHDALAHTFVFFIEEIDVARAKYESVVMTTEGPLQFDVASQARMEAIVKTLDGPGLEVIWKFADNSTLTLDQDKMRELMYEARSKIGPQLIAAFHYAQTLKDRFREGGRVTLRDIAPEKWV